MNSLKAIGLALALVLLAAPPGRAWFPKGHSILAEAAVKALPTEVPAFFRAGGGLVGHLAQDPDVAKARETPNLNNQEFPEHFIDYELLGGRPLPPTRYGFLKLCIEAKVEPNDAGLVPYAVTEWTERLAVAFAEHRRWPENPHIRTKALVYAGMLSHYATDMCMPLHTTIHYDGRAGADGKSPRTGIHMAVDSLIERLGLKPDELAKGQKVEAFDLLFPAVVKEMEESRTHIDEVYRLEPQLPPGRGAWTPSAEVTAFTKERGRESTRFLACLYLTAWKKSASIKLPSWLERERTAAAPAKK